MIFDGLFGAIVKRVSSTLYILSGINLCLSISLSCILKNFETVTGLKALVLAEDVFTTHQQTQET